MQSAYVYAYPSLNRLSFTQTGAIPLTFAATSMSAIGLRAGYILGGGWALEATAALASYGVNALVDEKGTRQDYTSRRIGIEVFRSVFSNYGKLRWNGNLRVGFQSQTVPLVYSDDSRPRIARLTSTNLGLGFAIGAYPFARTRLSLTAKWLPGLSASGNLPGTDALKSIFAYELALGAQHLLDENWSIGVFGNVQGATLQGAMNNLDGERMAMEAKNSEYALQLLAGYQF